MSSSSGRELGWRNELGRKDVKNTENKSTLLEREPDRRTSCPVLSRVLSLMGI
jgi:hypothetical protein